MICTYHQIHLCDEIIKNVMGWDVLHVEWVLVGKFEGKGSLERPRHKWKDNMKMGH